MSNSLNQRSVVFIQTSVWTRYVFDCFFCMSKNLDGFVPESAVKAMRKVLMYHLGQFFNSSAKASQGVSVWELAG